MYHCILRMELRNDLTCHPFSLMIKYLSLKHLPQLIDENYLPH